MGCVIEDQSGTKVLMDYGLAPTKPPKYPSEAPLIDRYNHPQSHRSYRNGTLAGRPPWNNSSWEQADIWSLGNNVARHIQGFQH